MVHDKYVTEIQNCSGWKGPLGKGVQDLALYSFPVIQNKNNALKFYEFVT